MGEKYVLALDQGTTSCRALLVNHEGAITGVAQKEFSQIFPKPGWVEHDPQEILDVQMQMVKEVLESNAVDAANINSIGITNQRETTVVWDKETGKAIYNAIVWQDKRTASICEKIKSRGLENEVRERTGLVVDSYFSATKVMWILDQVEGARQMAKEGRLICGTIDSWLIWNMTGGSSFVTDYSNASRTMLYNIYQLKWDEQLCQEFNVPISMLPAVQPSSHTFGSYQLLGHSIPIAGVAGDQQAALFGQQCLEPGMAKNTYGTGCFMLMQTGEKAPQSQNGLLTTIAWGKDNKVYYALEGSIFIAGAAVQWLRDALQILDHAADSEQLAKEAIKDHGVYVVPAFAGLGAPYWDMYARGAIFGLTRDTGRAEITEATLHSLAFQTRDVLEAMQQDSGLELDQLNVDGGATANNYLMQFQADILNVEVIRPKVTETTAMGAAFLAGLATEFWTDEQLSQVRKIDRIFSPSMTEERRSSYYQGWKKAVARTQGWQID
ncbi:MAG: glycerol kinase GlpK [Saprospiraceae bacterium]|nr:glycerol kinase GlpK [Saprospiraceae bacterium]